MREHKLRIDVNWQDHWSKIGIKWADIKQGLGVYLLSLHCGTQWFTNSGALFAVGFLITLLGLHFVLLWPLYLNTRCIKARCFGNPSVKTLMTSGKGYCGKVMKMAIWKPFFKGVSLLHRNMFQCMMFYLYCRGSCVSNYSRHPKLTEFSWFVVVLVPWHIS
jgi:hypothetical protein